MTKLTFSRLLESRTGVGDRIQEGSRNKAEAQSRKSEQQNPKHVAAPIQMEITLYLSRIFVYLSKLSFQTKSKTVPDQRIPGSSRAREQLLHSCHLPRPSPSVRRAISSTSSLYGRPTAGDWNDAA
jgi:hypothetical protein